MASVDVTFALRGETIPRDHGYAVFCAVSRELHWLAGERETGIHPIAGADTGEGRIFVTPRTRLVLRLPARRAEDARGLTGAQLDVGTGLTVGEARIRPLVPHDTLYARLVATERDDEQAFESEMADAMEAIGIRCDIICGQRGEVAVNARRVRGYSLLLHRLTPEQSLRVQETGAGPERRIGCGVFVPHKSAKAVGT